MLNLKSIVRLMSGYDYNRLTENLKETNALRYLTLLSVYRHQKHSKLSDEEVRDRMRMSPNAFHTMKSRLYDKLQEYLTRQFMGMNSNLLQKVAAIPDLVYRQKHHPHVAVAILEQLVKELTALDMPSELSKVYDALRKLHVNSQRYFDYTREYHKHVAYSIALDKANSLLMEFNQKTGEYYLSRNESMFEVLLLMKKEMNNLVQLYDSHRLRVYNYLVNTAFYLYIPIEEATVNDEPVEEMLNYIRKTVAAYPDDAQYRSVHGILDFLYFEYYHHAGLRKKEGQYFDALNQDIPGLLRQATLCFASHFLISKLEMYRYTERPDLMKENQRILRGYKTEFLDHVSYTNYMIYIAVSYFSSGQFKRSSKTLYELQKNVVFRNMLHTEVEVRLLMILAQLMNHEYTDARDQLKSLSVKLRKSCKNDERYKNVFALVRFLRMVINRTLVKTNHPKVKLHELRNCFSMLNNGSARVLTCIDWEDDALLKRMALITSAELEEA